MKQALFILILFTGGLLSAQSNLKLQFEPQTPRRVVDLKSEYTEVSICGLIAGQTYSIASGYISSDAPCSFEIGISKTSFSRNVMFVADEICETFWFRKTCDGDVSAYLSLVCNSCVVKEKGDTPEQGVVTDIFGGDLLSLIKDNFIGGNCFDVSNVTFSGGATQLGTFSNGTGAMGLETGIILSSGNVNLAQGPNSGGGTGSAAGGGFSDPDLNGLTGQSLFDVAVLEFDFIPTTDVIKFDFVFGSDEYCEYVNSQYNDVFGFFISGPGIAGSQNIALVPSDGSAITINTVNNGLNSAYFVPNSSSCGSGPINNDIEYDGYTTVLTATAVIPDTSCQTYHLRLGIADGSDAIYDSGVFLKKGSFNAGSEYEVTANDLISGTDETVEGCGDAFFRFNKLADSKFPVDITFTILGTATSGVDYAPLPTTITIPAEDQYFDLPVTIFADGIPEGLETIELLIDANVCSCLNPTIVLNIVEPDPILVQQFDTVLCEGSSGSLVLDPNAVGGAPPLTYDWSNGSTLSSITVPSATGTYSVTVTDACGGTEEAVWNITEAPAPTVDISGDGSICNGGFVDIDLAFTGTGPWTVEIYKDGLLWNTMTFLTANAVFSVSDVGVYTVPGVSTSSCDGFGYGAATITEATLQTTAIVSNELCAGQDNGSIEVIPINPGSYTYTWSPSQPDNPLIENLSPGLYELTISDASGCTAIETYDVFAATPMTVDSFSTEVNCLNPSDGTIDLLVGGGQPGYTYTWDNGANTASLFGLTVGTYYFTVTDANNCEVTGSETVEEGDGFPVANIEPAPMIDCNNPTISLSGNGSSTSAGTSYSWVTTDGNIVSGSTTLSPVIDMGGTYTLIVTNALGCVKDTSVTVLDDLTEPIANVAALGELDCSNPSMTLVDNGSSTGSDFSYLWTTADGNIVSGNTSLTPVVNLSGTYTLVVTNDVNGCTATVDVPVTGDTISPIAMINPAGALSCVDSVITLDGAGSSTGSEYTYNWTTSDGNIISGEDALNPVINQQGAYTLVVTNSNNGCTSTESIAISENMDVAVVDAGSPLVIGCSQPSVQLNGSFTPTNANFEWTTTDGNIVSGAMTLTPEVNAQGSYTLVVTHPASGCTSESTVSVSLDQNAPVADAGQSADLTCALQNLNLDATGNTSQGANYTYFWTTTDGNIVSGNTTLEPEINMQGTYQLVVTDASNGCSSVSTVVVGLDNQAPIANVTSVGQVDCNSSSVTFVDNGSSTGSDFTYSWTTFNGNIVSGATTLTPEIDLAGTYTLLITDVTNGCTATTDVSVAADTLPPLAVANVNGVLSCIDTVLALSGTGSSTGTDYSYSWTTPNGNILSGTTSLSPQVDQQGTYVLVVTNNTNGCSSSESVLVAQNLDVATPDAGDATTIGCTQTSAILNGSILPSNATFEWVTLNGNIVGGATTLTPEVNSHGDYTLIATHPVSGCTSESTVTVGLDQDVPVANAGTGVDITCNTPTISLDGSNSSQGANYTYNWSTTDGNIVSGGSTLSPIVDTSGVYQLMVTDNANGCTSLSSVTIGLNNQPPSVDPGLPATIDCNSPIVTLGPSTPSGNANLTYTWTTVDGNIVAGAATENPKVNSDGLYEVVVTDNTNGCTSAEQVLIDEDLNYPTVGLTGDDEITCTAASATITAVASSTGAITYNWTTTDGFIQFGNGTNAITVNQAGTYAVDIVNTDNGCSVQDSFVVSTNADFPNAVAAAPSELTCLVDTVEIYGTGSSSGSQFVYSWTTADGNIISASNILDVVVDEPGTYILGVTDITNNCASTFTITVNENLEVPTADAGLTQTLLCGVDSLQLAGMGSANGGSVEYAWTTQNGSILSGNNTASPFVNASGTYFLNVTNSSNGCSAMDSVIIGQDVNIPTVDAGPDLMINCQVNSVELGTTNTANGSNFTYQWTASNGGVLPTNSNTPFLTVTDAGTYELLVTNTDNGCKAVSVVDVEKNVDLPVIDPGLPSELNCLVDTTLVGGLGTSAGLEFSYAWTTPNGNIVSGNNSSQALVNAPGDYVLVVTNMENFCESQMNISVTENVVEPSISMGSPSLITCTTPTVDLSANGSSAGSEFDYLWSTTSGNIVSGEMSLTPTVNQPGFYTLLITNSLNGCSAIDSVEVDKDNSQPTALIEPVAKLTCDVSEIMIDATNSSSGSNYSYSWTTTNGNIISGADALSPTINSPGDYHLVVLDNSNNCTSFADVTVDENVVLPIVEAGPNTTIYCGDTSVALDGTGTDVGASFVYQWTTLNGNIVSGAATLLPAANEVGTYYLTVENTANGCQAVDSVVIVADVNAPVIVIANSPQLTCDVTEIVINATNSSSGADFDYSWSTGNGHIVAGGKSNSPTIDKEGKYLLTLTNTLNGCETTKEVDIEQNIEEPVVAGTVNDMLTCKLDEVGISASATGAGTLFDYQWSSADGNIVSGDLTSSPKVNLKGTYTVIVKDLSNGCTSEKSFVVDENKLAPDLALANPDDITCKQSTVVLNASSSNNDVSYNWTALTGNIVSGANSATPVVNQTGDYEVVITSDGNGCTTSKIVAVSENVTKPIADAGQDFDIPCSSNSVQIGPANVNPDYIYSWSTSTGNIVSGANSSNPIVSAVGSYLLQVENKENGCVEDDAMYVAAPPKVLDLAFDIKGVVCNGAGGSIKVVSVTGGTPPYLFSFDNGNSFSALDVQDGLVSGAYNVVVQDVMGCEYEAYAMVPSAVLPVLETNSIYYIESGDSTQLQVFTSILPDDIDTVIWSPIEYLSCTNCLNPIAKPLVSTNYEVAVIDKNGCDASARIAIFVSDPDIYIPNVFSPNSNNLENSSFYIHAKPNKVKEITALSIYDRWGNQVFIQEHFLPNDPYAGWDGKFRDLELEPGVYVYHAVIEFVSGKKVSYSGDVTIVK